MIYETKDITDKAFESIKDAFEKLNEDRDIKSFSVSLLESIYSEDSLCSLADRSGFGVSYLYSLMKGNRSPTMKSLLKILCSYNLALSICPIVGNPFVSQNQQAHLINLLKISKEKGSMYSLAKEVNIYRPSLHRILSNKGNPYLTSLMAILKALNLRVSVAHRNCVLE